MKSLSILIEERKKEKELEKILGPRLFKTVALPENEWYTCSRCNGTSSYLMSGDAHRSEGWVPCGCSGGKIKSKTIEIKRKVRVKATSQKV